jgi:hypothetical protein
MATRSLIGGIRRLGGSQAEITGGSRASVRLFSDDKGKVLSEEERAKENVFIKVPLISIKLHCSDARSFFS